MKLVILAVSALAIFTVKSHDTYRKTNYDIQSADNPSSSNQNELALDQLLSSALHMEMNNVPVPHLFHEENERQNGERMPGPPGGACSDKYPPSCPFWEKAGYCKGHYETWMSSNCKKSCKLCTLLPPAILKYKIGRSYEEIWNDKGSGGYQDVSIWRPTYIASGYCSLGDVAHRSYGTPGFGSISVSGLGVAHPTGFRKIWDDSGSGARLDCALYEMICPAGHIGLGGVALRNYHYTNPDTRRYCCISTDFLKTGNALKLYQDKGTGAHDDLTIWKIVGGLSGNNFLPVKSHDEGRKPSNPKVLDPSKVTHG